MMNRADQYRNVQIATADPVRLVIMLYDGVIRFNKLAEKAILEKDIKGRSAHLNRSLEIFGELSTALDRAEGGEIADNLARLYDFCVVSLTEANIRNDASLIGPVNRVVSELKSGWESIANGRQRQERAEPRSISCGA